MAEFTRPATWDDLRTLARYLNEAEARYALVGGYAIAAHGFVRFSEDIDILVDPAPDNTPSWVAALSRLPDAAAKELADDPDIFQREGNYAIRVNDEFTVDVLPAACGHSWRELSAYVEEVELEGVPLRVLSLEGLLLTKEGLRDRDRADAAVLKQAIAKIRARDTHE
ncbi:MAG: nucleotidyl transferase AbiEii/AbiGii toxin family protein [Myxococcales bacterium]|nr:nucleotidyl transferase AbiEii/AbiGii toxin family protein [Myxococcales bacterium]